MLSQISMPRAQLMAEEPIPSHDARLGWPRRFLNCFESATIAVALCVVSATPALAQTTSITGLVTDATNASIPNAAVSVRNSDTGVTRRATTNAQGYYTVPLLPQGAYAVRAEAAGFQPLEKAGLHLDEGQVLRLDIKLEVGVSLQAIQVTQTTAALETETSAQSTVVNKQVIVDLPQNGRNPLSLAAIVPGVRPVGSFGALSNSAYTDGRISISGGSPSVNNTMIDGVAAENHTSGGLQVVLSPDATGEFRIITRNASAEYGRTGGGVINIISRSGTNKYQGSMWEFLQNKSLNANDFFSNRTGKARAPFTYNQYGATLGGPIFPNRTFFFLNWEGVRQRKGSRQLYTVPTDLQRQGDFSQTYNSSGRLMTIYDPLTSQPSPSLPGRYIRLPFNGNVIPNNRLNSVALAVSTYFPPANIPGNTFTGANNLQGYGSQGIDKDLIGLKIDHYFTASRRLAGRYTWDRTKNVYPSSFGGTIADPNGAPAVYPRTSAVINYTDALRPDFLFEFRTGLNRFGIDRTCKSYGFDVTKINLPALLNKQLQFQQFPYFTFSDVSPLGQNQGDASGQRNNSWTVGGTFTWIKGQHNVKYGAEARAYQWNSVQGLGQINFSSTQAFTSGPDPNAAASNGYGYASFLLGYPASGVLYRYPYPMYTTKNSGTFIQDDWKFSRKLTLNLGLRWEREGPTTDRYNAISNFDPNVEAVVNGIRLHGGMAFPGANSLPRGNRNASWTHFGPRLGLAYQVLRTTVIRGSYGIFYLPSTGIFITLGNTGFSSQTAYLASVDGGLTPAGSLSDPFPQGIVVPTGSSLGPLTGLGTAVTGNLRSLTTGYSQQWNFNIQQQLPGSWSIEIGYIGNRGIHLPVSRSFYYLPASARALGTDLQTLVDNPYASLVSVGPLSKPQVTRATLLYTYPQFAGASGLDNWASSTYHAATVRLERRFANGFSLLVAYTYSKLLDNSLGNGNNAFGDAGSNSVQDWDNLRAEKALSTSDQPQRLTVSGSYAFPFGRAGNRFYRAVAGGWQVNTIASCMSGNVISVTANAPAFGGDRPNVVGNPSVDRPTVDQWLNRAAFTNIPAFTFGNGPRNLPRTRSEALLNFDASLFRNIRTTERFTLELRAEAFNVANRATLGNPSGNINLATFGQTTSLRMNTAPRVLQFGLKLLF